MDLFNQPGLYTHYVEYERYKEYTHSELNASRTGFNNVYTIDKTLRKWASSLPMEEGEVDNFIRCFVTGRRCTSGEYRIIKLDKATTNKFQRNPSTINNNYEKYSEA